jgi:hypothetical protein
VEVSFSCTFWEKETVVRQKNSRRDVIRETGDGVEGTEDGRRKTEEGKRETGDGRPKTEEGKRLNAR